MKRTAEDQGEGATEPKRQLNDMQAFKVPGGWPDDEDDYSYNYNYTYTSRPASPPTPPRRIHHDRPKNDKLQHIKDARRPHGSAASHILAFISFFNPLRIFKQPVAPSQHLQKTANSTHKLSHSAHASEEQQHARSTPATAIQAIATPHRSPQAPHVANQPEVGQIPTPVPAHDSTRQANFKRISELQGLPTASPPSEGKTEALQQHRRQRRDSFGDYFAVPETLYTPQKAPAQLPQSYIGEQARQQHELKHRIPRGWGSGEFDPQSIIPTPVRLRATRTPHSARRWSPYHYEHGVARPKKSVLKSSKPDFKRFESSLVIPSPHAYIEEEISPVDEEGDFEMLDGNKPIRERSIRLAREDWSVFTAERIDPVHGVGKFYRTHLGINEKYGPAFEHYRDPKPEFDPDQSFQESPPKPAGFDHEQKKSPSKTYSEVVDDHMQNGMEKFYKELELRFNTDGLSRSLRDRYAAVEAQAAAQRELERSKKHHAERRAREAEENKIREEQRQKAKDEEMRKQIEKEMMEQYVAQEKAMRAEKEVQDRLAKEKAASEQRAVDRSLPEETWSTTLPVYEKVVDALEITNPSHVLIERPQLNRHDLGTLLPLSGDAQSGWLNDAIVVTALEHLVKAANKQVGHDMMQREVPAPYWVFNSNWYTMVGNGSGISKWAAKRGVNLSGKNLLKARKILFPVCEGSHWTVTILDPRNRTIESMNSMDTSPNSGYNKRIQAKILSWVRHELGSDFMAVEWQSHRPMTCHQNNASDCGVFTIMNSVCRVSGLPTWVMRRLVNPSNMGLYRHYIAGVLFNGGFDTDGPFRLKVQDRLWEGTIMEDPDYTRDNLDC